MEKEINSSYLNKYKFKFKNRKPKVLFTIPNFKWVDDDLNALWDLIPWNLCMLSSVIRDECDVKIYDAYKLGHDEETFIKEVKKYKPDIVGITVLLDQYGIGGHKTAELVKRCSSKIVTILGGVYATTNPDIAVDDSNIDFVIQGEGEEVLKQMIKFFKSEDDFPNKGICYKENDEIINLGHSDFIRDLDNLPLPSYDLIDYMDYANNYADRKSVDAPPEYPYARVVTSRGCPYGCTFCQVPFIQGSKFRPRSPENVVEEIKWLKNTYGIKSIIFDDDNLFTYKNRAKDLFRLMIENDVALPWLTIATAVFRLDKEMIDLMSESGCKYVDVAIESGNERVIRKVVNKPVVLDRAKDLISYTMSKGIFVAANFIVGFPTETWQEIRDTINFAEELNPDYAKIFIALPLQHTKMYDMAIKENAIAEEAYDATKIWTSGQMMETRDWKADDLTFLRAYEWDRLNFSNPKKKKRIAERMGISEQELDKIRRRTLDGAIKKIKEKNIKADKKDTYPNVNIKNAADQVLVS